MAESHFGAQEIEGSCWIRFPYPWMIVPGFTTAEVHRLLISKMWQIGEVGFHVGIVAQGNVEGACRIDRRGPGWPAGRI